MSNPTESLPTPAKKSPESHDKFVTYLYAIVQGLKGNAYYAAPTPSVADLETAADGLVDANAEAKDGGTLAVAHRNALRKDADHLVDQLVAYVRATVIATAGDPATARAMITSAGLSVRKRTRPQKPALATKYGAASGQILLIALAVAKSAVYLWEYSLDQRVWTSVPQTMRADTAISGLTLGQVYYFRFRAQTRKVGLGDYSQVVSVVMH